MFASLSATLVALTINAAFASFNCSDIVGVVFDAQNRYPHHDYGDGGLPYVRIATINGVWITTDWLVRFSLPSAVMPERFASHFVLRVYDPSLPDDMRLNPRA